MNRSTHKGKWIGTNSWIHGKPLKEADGMEYIVTIEYNSRTNQFVEKKYPVYNGSITREVTP